MKEKDILKEDPQDTDQFAETKKNRNTKKMSRTGRIILLIVLGVILLALIGAGIYIWHIFNRPNLFFDTVTRVSATETPAVTPLFEIERYLPTEEPGTTPIPISVYATPTPTPAPEKDAEPVATLEPEELEKLSGIVNIALFGIDAYEDGSSTSGSMPHTDANLILAINFDTGEVSMISIARDCLTTAPGYNGFYKFNGVFNVGGGMDDPKAGFELSCRAAEEWLGGVSIPYYYGVDFQALIDLVDMVGGIDFDVDIKLYLLDGRRINPGKRHLDGQGVMAYMRMRRSADGRDSSRTARQRKMLVAVFKKLKQEGKLSQIPDILKILGDNVYTNTGKAQTAALVDFAQGLDPDSIRSYSIQGTIQMDYDWAFCFIDQQDRLDILKEVYGINAEPMGVNSVVYERYLHDNGFKALLYLNITRQLFDAVHRIADESTMSEAQKTAYAACWKDYSDLQAAYDYADKWMRAHYDGKSSDEEKEEFKNCIGIMHELEKKLRSSGDALNAAFDNPIRARWDYSISNWSEQGSPINEVYVDFR